MIVRYVWQILGKESIFAPHLLSPSVNSTEKAHPE